ncbi:MAG: hypothetical protein U0441_18495 [Polyangiaceae bacterium]
MTLALLTTPLAARAQTPDPAANPPRPISATPNGAGSPTPPPGVPVAGVPATPTPPVVTPSKAPAPAAAPAGGSWKKPLPKLPEAPPLPDTQARLWLIAPGPKEPWTMRIDNDGDKAIRIPADVRLLTFEIQVESADPKKKKPTVYKCEAPSSIKPTAFPEKRALLLAPEQSYIETFDPRLFCFGKNDAALVGTALVKARFGWQPAAVNKWAKKKKPEGPFAVESTENPSPTAPVKQLVAPSIVLSFGTPAGAKSEPPQTIAGADVNIPGAPAPGAYRPPPPPPKVVPPPPPPPAHNPLAPLRSGGRGRDIAISRKRLAAQQKELAAAQQEAATQKDAAQSTTTDATTTPANGTAPANGTTAATAPANGAAPANATAPEAPKIVDQNAPRLAIETSAFADASAPASAQLTVTIKNAGARSMVAAIKPRMISFEIVGPDRTVTCPAFPPTHALPRESFRELKPEGKTSFTLLLDEVCPDDVFSRPGLYSVKAGVWANENGDEVGVTGFTGRAKASDPTLLRLQSAKESFYFSAPKAVPTPKPPPDSDAPAPATPADGSAPASEPAPENAAPTAPENAAPSAPPKGQTGG